MITLKLKKQLILKFHNEDTRRIEKPPTRAQLVKRRMRKLGIDTGEWVRLPKPRERFHGLARTTLLELCDRGLVKSAYVKPRRHSVRGIRLIYLPSLLAYLHANATGGQ